MKRSEVSMSHVQFCGRQKKGDREVVEEDRVLYPGDLDPRH